MAFFSKATEAAIRKRFLIETAQLEGMPLPKTDAKAAAKAPRGREAVPPADPTRIETTPPASTAGALTASTNKKSSGREQPFKLVPGDRVVIIGDSLANGLQATAAYGYDSAMTHEMKDRKLVFARLGKGGTNAAQWGPRGGTLNHRLLGELKRKPKAVLVVLGTNDCHYATEFNSKFATRMNAIAKQIKEAGSTPILVGMPTMPWENTPGGAERMAAARDALRAAAEANGGIYIPPPDEPVARWKDKLHASASGNKIWAAYIMHNLDLAGEKQP